MPGESQWSLLCCLAPHLETQRSLLGRVVKTTGPGGGTSDRTLTTKFFFSFCCSVFATFTWQIQIRFGWIFFLHLQIFPFPLSSSHFLYLGAVVKVTLQSSVKISRVGNTVCLAVRITWMYLMRITSRVLPHLLLKTWPAEPLSWDITWKVHKKARIQMKSGKKVHGETKSDLQASLFLIPCH